MTNTHEPAGFSKAVIREALEREDASGLIAKLDSLKGSYAVQYVLEMFLHEDNLSIGWCQYVVNMLSERK